MQPCDRQKEHLKALFLEQALVVCNRAPVRKIVGPADPVQQFMFFLGERSLAWLQIPVQNPMARLQQ